MKSQIKLLVFSSAILAPLSVLAQPVCPVCTVAVCAGLGLARWLKIDDTITGLWVAGLLIAVVGWTVKFLEKRKWNFPYRTFVTAVVLYLSVFIPLYLTKMVGDPLHQLWGIDKLILGVLVGSLGFGLSLLLHQALKKKNNDKVYFPYQKVIIPVSALLILSVAFYFVTKYC
ncbi:MAG: hypothetical protein NTV62_00235 [Candidatus Gribaldobacteria bacterium]|nr:hypothetical protein [Candidatus Gribaldobacteria bacterium]